MNSVKSIAEEISILIPKMMRNIKAEFFTKVKFSTSQFIIMVSIYERGTVSSGILAEEHGVSNPTITGIVDRLVKQGYLRRRHHKKDRRKILISLTSKGKNTVRNFQGIVQKRWVEVLKNLSRKEQQSFIKIIKKINKTISEK